MDGVGLHFAPVRSDAAAPETRNTLFFGWDLADRQRHAGIRDVDDNVDLVDVEPLVGHLRADVRLVLVVAADHFDFHVGMGLGEVGNCQLGGGN